MDIKDDGSTSEHPERRSHTVFACGRPCLLRSPVWLQLLGVQLEKCGAAGLSCLFECEGFWLNNVTAQFLSVLLYRYTVDMFYVNVI